MKHWEVAPTLMFRKAFFSVDVKIIDIMLSFSSPLAQILDTYVALGLQPHFARYMSLLHTQEQLMDLISIVSARLPSYHAPSCLIKCH